MEDEDSHTKCFLLDFEFPLTNGIFETGAYRLQSKSQNPNVLGQSHPSSTQWSNPSWTCQWHHPFGMPTTILHFDTVLKTMYSISHWIFLFFAKIPNI